LTRRGHTQGELAFPDVVIAVDTTEDCLLRRADGLKRCSEHPIAGPILSRADKATVGGLPDLTGFESATGKGIRGAIDIENISSE